MDLQTATDAVVTVASYDPTFQTTIFVIVSALTALSSIWLIYTSYLAPAEHRDNNILSAGLVLLAFFSAQIMATAVFSGGAVYLTPTGTETPVWWVLLCGGLVSLLVFQAIRKHGLYGETWNSSKHPMSSQVWVPPPAAFFAAFFAFSTFAAWTFAISNDDNAYYVIAGGVAGAVFFVMTLGLMWAGIRRYRGFVAQFATVSMHEDEKKLFTSAEYNIYFIAIWMLYLALCFMLGPVAIGKATAAQAYIMWAAGAGAMLIHSVVQYWIFDLKKTNQAMLVGAPQISYVGAHHGGYYQNGYGQAPAPRIAAQLPGGMHQRNVPQQQQQMPYTPAPQVPSW